MPSNKFDKRDCAECGKKTWHFKASDKGGYECGCKAVVKELKTPDKPITYSPQDDVVSRAVVKPLVKPPVSGYVSTHMKPTYVSRVRRPAPLTSAQCVGCGAGVKPGSCYTGSVLGNLQHFTKDGVEIAPIYGTMIALGEIYILGGGEIHVTKRVAFHKRHKGYLCDRCSVNMKRIKDTKGVEHLLVKVDPLVREKPRDIKWFGKTDTSVSDPRPDPKATVDATAYNALHRVRPTRDRDVTEHVVPAQVVKNGAFGSKWIGRQ